MGTLAARGSSIGAFECTGRSTFSQQTDSLSRVAVWVALPARSASDGCPRRWRSGLVARTFSQTATLTLAGRAGQPVGLLRPLGMVSL
jgi:hypothetical protein